MVEKADAFLLEACCRINGVGLCSSKLPTSAHVFFALATLSAYSAFVVCSFLAIISGVNRLCNRSPRASA